MARYEYKTIKAKRRFGIIFAGDPDFEGILNHESRGGWRLCEVITKTRLGYTDYHYLILEREVDAASTGGAVAGLDDTGD